MTARAVAIAGAIAAAGLLLAAQTPRPTPLSGVWQAVKVNKQALPMTDRVVGDDGLTHAVRLHEMTIRLRPNGRFQAALRYRQAILSKGERIEAVPQQNDTWTGIYTMAGSHLRFVPEKQGKRQVQPFEGDVAGKLITVAFDYQIVTKKHYVLDLNKNDNIF